MSDEIIVKRKYCALGVEWDGAMICTRDEEDENGCC